MHRHLAAAAQPHPERVRDRLERHEIDGAAARRATALRINDEVAAGCRAHHRQVANAASRAFWNLHPADVDARHLDVALAIADERIVAEARIVDTNRRREEADRAVAIANGYADDFAPDAGAAAGDAEVEIAERVAHLLARAVRAGCWLARAARWRLEQPPRARRREVYPRVAFT